MALNRVSTYNVHQTTLRESMRVQTDLFNTQNQISSGLKAQYFSDLNGQVEQLAELENKITRSVKYIDNNKIADARLNTADTSLDQMVDTVTNLRNLVILRRNESIGGSVGFDQQLEGAWKAFAGQMNVNLEGRYLFSGTATDRPPVDIDTFPATILPGVPDAGYYKGAAQSSSMRIQDGVDTDFPARGDDPAFQKIAAAFALAKQGDAEGDDTKLSKAYDMLSDGMNGLIDLRTSMNAAKAQIADTSSRLDSLKLYWQGVKESISNTDMVEASTRVAIDQGTLQASFQAFAKINSLQLSDYLR